MTDYPLIPPGEYPFGTVRLPLDELAMAEVAPEFEQLLLRTASENGTEIGRDQVIELRCVSEDRPDATFVVWWPTGAGRLHVLVPRDSIRGRA